MRNGIFISALLIVGTIVASSASCGGSGSGTGGSSGSGGSAGAGGTKGTKGSGGSSGTKGSGGTMGSSNPCIKDQSKCTAGLKDLSAPCETCIAMNCSMDFETCVSTPGCIAGLNCIIPCFHAGGTLVECGSKCGP